MMRLVISDIPRLSSNGDGEEMRRGGRGGEDEEVNFYGFGILTVSVVSMRQKLLKLRKHHKYCKKLLAKGKCIELCLQFCRNYFSCS